MVIFAMSLMKLLQAQDPHIYLPEYDWTVAEVDSSKVIHIIDTVSGYSARYPDLQLVGTTRNLRHLLFLSPVLVADAFAVWANNGEVAKQFRLTSEASPPWVQAYNVYSYQHPSDGATFAVNGDLTRFGTDAVQSYLQLNDDQLVGNFGDLEIFPEVHGMMELPNGDLYYVHDEPLDHDYDILDGGNWVALYQNVYKVTPDGPELVADFIDELGDFYISRDYLLEQADTVNQNLDQWHFNSLFYDEDLNGLISYRHIGCYKFDLETGDLIYAFGLPAGKATELGFPEPWSEDVDTIDLRTRWQHDFHMVPSGPYMGSLSVYSNGDEEDELARVLLFEVVDEATMEIDVKRIIHTNISSPFMGSAKYLSDGTVLINAIEWADAEQWPEWNNTGQQDLVLDAVRRSGSRIIHMDIATGEVLMRATSINSDYIYSLFPINEPAFPKVLNDGEQYFPSQPGLFNLEWFDAATGAYLDNTYELPLETEEVFFQFKKGIFDCRSRPLKADVVTAAGQAWLSAVELYPNPATDRLYTGSDHKAFRYELWTVNGKLAGQGETTDGSIDVRSLSSGVYTLSINGAHRNFVKQ